MTKKIDDAISRAEKIVALLPKGRMIAEMSETEAKELLKRLEAI